jgi:hypothetical protein
MVLGTEMSALVRQFTKRTTPMRDGLIELPLLAAEFAKLKQLWVLCRKLSTSLPEPNIHFRGHLKSPV